MPRAVIVGSGSEISGHEVTNDMLARLLDTNDKWIRERSGVETRYYVEEGTSTSDLGMAASERALEMAGVERDEVDLVIFATMTPDNYFPGASSPLQTKLGLRPVPCFDIRQQCVGFVYGLQMADAHIRAGMAKTVLLVGAEVHTGFLPFSAANWKYLYGESKVGPTQREWDRNSGIRHLLVLFGDAGAAVVVKAMDDDSGRGAMDHEIHCDGAEMNKLYVPGNGFARRPYIDTAQLAQGEHIPRMDGRTVFKMATTKMAEVAHSVLKRNGVRPDDLKLVLMHQANRRINEYVQKLLELPDEKVLHNIHKYGNTTAATIPLLWDEAVREDLLHTGDLVLCVAFGAGMGWGASLIRA